MGFFAELAKLKKRKMRKSKSQDWKAKRKTRNKIAAASRAANRSS